MYQRDTAQLIMRLESRIGVVFKNKSIALAAVTHRSYLNEARGEPNLEHYERLEFLGDAVLEEVVSHNIYRKINVAEGRMTNLRAVLVNGRAMAKVGEELRLGEFVSMSRGELKDSKRSDNKAGQYILGCVVEAVIGAIRVDRGYGVAELFIHQHILPRLEIIRDKELRDPKGMLQELVQAKGLPTPEYRVLQEKGPDHAKEFVAAVYVNNVPLGTGVGFSKDAAHVHAAVNALRDHYGIEAAIL